MVHLGCGITEHDGRPSLQVHVRVRPHVAEDRQARVRAVEQDVFIVGVAIGRAPRAAGATRLGRPQGDERVVRPAVALGDGCDGEIPLSLTEQTREAETVGWISDCDLDGPQWVAATDRGTRMPWARRSRRRTASRPMGSSRCRLRTEHSDPHMWATPRPAHNPPRAHRPDSASRAFARWSTPRPQRCWIPDDRRLMHPRARRCRRPSARVAFLRRRSRHRSPGPPSRGARPS